MNKRSIVVAICVVAICICALTVGKTARLDSITSGQRIGEPKPLPKANRGGSLITASLNENKELTLSSTPQTDAASIPDYVVYGHLFRSILMFREMAAEEEKQGRLGEGYTKAVQASLKLDDTTAKALDEAATTWSTRKQEMEARADAIMKNYEAAKAQALSSDKPAPPNPDGELKQVYEQLNDSLLVARDDLRESLGDAQFETFKKAVEENITPNIKQRRADPNDPALVKRQERVSPLQRFQQVPANAVIDEGGRLMVRHELPQVNQAPPPVSPDRPKLTPFDIESDAKQGKAATLDSTRIGNTFSWDQTKQPDQELNFCFFGGIVFYGTFVWLVPSVSQLIQVSFTQLDFCAGLNFDPYVFAVLEDGSNFNDGESLGRSFVRPAVVENHLFAHPSTFYAASAEHWITNCRFLETFCDWFFIDAYTIFILTPECVHGFSLTFPTCQQPSPSPTPTPTVRIDSVGFTGDFPLRRWSEDVTQRTRIDFPDGTEATWNRASDPRSAVAYKRGTNPTLFATFVVNPAPAIAVPVQLRVKKGDTLLATAGDSIGGGRAEIRNIPISFSGLESAAVVKRGNYTLTWEISFDNGSHWQNAGRSGPHKIYWTWDNPLSDIWQNQAENKCFFVAEGTECNTLYDEALQRAAGNAEGKSNVDDIVDKITKRLAAQIIYDPCRPDLPDVPLLLTSPAFNRGQCSTNANLLRGLLRTIGIDAKTNYYWGGDDNTAAIYFYNWGPFAGVSFRVKRRANNEGKNILALMQCPDVERDRHFAFHAMVEVAGKVYDPSYGLTNQNPTASDTAQLKAIEVSAYPDPGFFLDNAVPADRVVMRDRPLFEIPGLRLDTERTCSHAANVFTSSFPNIFPNPIDDAEFYVAQHYLDFLGRDADPGGLAFWRDGILQCGSNVPCIEDKRVHTSLAFFLSIEFQERGYFVHRFYKSAFGRNPLFNEFITDMGKMSTEWQSGELETDKQLYAQDFVETQAFKNQYPFTMEFATFVDTLFANAGIAPDPTQRANLINGLAAGTETRATVLRQVVDTPAFHSAEFRKAFVEMCYFGYLRRDPDPEGYNHWLNSLNNSNGDIYHLAKAFLFSSEYRGRFGQP